MSVEGLSLIGVDHHRTPVDLRERLAVGPADIEECLRFLGDECGVAGAVVLSTCNRTEYYLADADRVDAVLAQICQRQGIPPESIQAHTYRHDGEAALRHLFRVVASLESMVVGEYQILHQVKYAYEQSRLHGITTAAINRFFQRALAVGKEVRNETGIGRHKLSTASIAVDLAKAIHGDLRRANLLLTGAGEMAELALQHFLEQGVRRLSIINRNRQRAEDLAASLLHRTDLEVQIRHWNELGTVLADHDIVLSSTAAPVPVIRQDDVRQAVKRRRSPLMLIDLAVPRDVAPEVAEVDDAYLYNIDALEQVVARNRQLRVEEVDAAADLVERRVQETLREAAVDLGNLRKDIAAYFDRLAAAEAQRLAGKIRHDEGTPEYQELAYGMQRLARKMQHNLLTWLRHNDERADAEDIIRSLIGKEE